VVSQVQHKAYSAAAVFRDEGASIIFVFPTAETADFVYIHFGEAFNFLFLFLFLLSYRQLSLSYRYSDTIAIGGQKNASSSPRRSAVVYFFM
jgi:hypothetical protein